MIEGFQPDPDILSFHRLGPSAQNTSARGQISMRPGVRGIELSVSRERSLIKSAAIPAKWAVYGIVTAPSTPAPLIFAVDLQWPRAV